MIITCEECQARFSLDENLLKPTGSKVRCSKCKKVFVAYPPELPKDAVKEEATAVEEAVQKPVTDEGLASEPQSEPGEADEDVMEELDFDIDTEPEKEKAEPDAEAAAADESPDDLDLSDLEDMLDEEITGGVAEEPVEELDLELDLETEDDQAAAMESAAGDAASDELDLSELEDLLAEPELEELAEEPVEELDLELDLETEDDLTAATEPAAGDAASDELDLSELEDILSEDGDDEVADGTVDDLDLELELDAELDETPEAPAESDLVIEETDELDLSEIEQALDSDDLEIEIDDEPEEVELELSSQAPELEAVAGEEGDDIVSGGLEDVDLTDIEKMLEVEDEDEHDEDEIEFEGLDDIGELVDETDIPDLDETERIELTLEDSETDAFAEDEAAVEKEPEEEALEGTDPFYVETQIIDKTTEELITPTDEVAAEEELEVKTKPAAKKRVSKPVLVLVVLLLLGAAGVGTVFLLNYLNIEVPFVGEFLTPKAADPSGNLHIETSDVQDRFVANAASGKLLIITGKATNRYSDVRSSIRVTGRLYVAGEKPASTATVFCGNIVADDELKTLDIASIKKRLANRTGDNQSNTQVKPGQQIPFMIVFNNLPQNLDKYEIEVAGSSAAK